MHFVLLGQLLYPQKTTVNYSLLKEQFAWLHLSTYKGHNVPKMH